MCTCNTYNIMYQQATNARSIAKSVCAIGHTRIVKYIYLDSINWGVAVISSHVSLGKLAIVPKIEAVAAYIVTISTFNSLGPIAHICAHLFQTFGAHSAYMRASSSPSSKEDASVYATAVYHRQSQDRQYYNNKLFSAAKTGQSPCL